MGGKSSSKQSTSNTQHTNNIVNDGDFAGAGDVWLDESETITTVKDSNNTDNSVNFDIEQDIDNSIEQDIDNSIENDGDFSGITGNVTVLDGGAIEAARSIAERALTESTKQNEMANMLSARALESNERVSFRAFNTAEHAIDEVQDIARNSIAEVGETSEQVIDSLTASSVEFANSLQTATEANFAANEQALQTISEGSTEDKNVIAELARSTSLAGQDIVAKSSEKMVLYMAAAVGLGFVAMLFMNRRG